MSGDRKDLRKFGITIGVVFMMLGVLFFLKGGHNAVYLLFLGVVFTVLGVTVPLLLKPFYRIWMTAADMLGQLVTGIILCILFYIVITPLGFIAKLLGKHFVDLGFYVKQESYWNYKEQKELVNSDYERQF
ncbi:MAG: hypothetical protein A3C80_00370 [Candidatus Ryanbacteria bacterium RIFCSPHIGHO2_02_FULL_45_43]|uniref:SxtJ n=1 Tax=Candidatus Ryanbacteria bacterium RIFCSPHIGHO2_01_45_13 TaxID=1802112 RepID=A0A1G2FYU1_9BACT|nr:MAG: hypothetical protein A2718_01760 [Candidatus Ryanbacteria bacterium RIFCSPHIGHO2_01_FULL_44_130]OGZ42741.1 MAG: hypothetical protein A2W41_03305 [Candidatus Ryanbacteria bacterium RIFCSPHIGHO2_01_45_13]OGZ48771.1 MAG: hypothetical protein A3C80_00370 [Candidatus Ryanbacteria bacterium RIFCSPHIGHO2_02_FULL_45_43]OGZ50803.1 MAG: hypothetical protein A3E55_02390 [Candidatus Ryanbacteria bacterium RIFCSPHIGHO2_12_FULL_44_20]OGZ52014.1 MAG: hypothetical protein A3A17_00975 [Candidatus Ryanba